MADASAPSSFPFRIEFPPELPISARAEEIVAAIAEHQVVILAGETGSGKTTQIPKMCLAAGRGQLGQIACTQPRRVAALSISRRVADELGVEWGRGVGCKIRFNDQTSSDTVIKFLTDGMLLAEVQGDPLLRAYDTIIIDEAHERSLNIDFLLGHLRQLRYRRPELKVIITSATIDTEAFSAAFDGAPIIQVSGRTYPVEVIYAPLDELGSDSAEGDEPDAKAEALHYIDGAAEAVERIVRESTSGDILVFLPAERDIREVGELIDGRRLPNCEVVPLFGRLSNSEQQRVFSPSQRRKIVVATNIAETSLTIPGIRFVVDTGLARLSRYAATSRTKRLPIEPISQSSADQRKGRCGRVAEGVCIRLYSEKDFNERPRFTQPEIQRANLADVILRMKASDLGDIERFPFINMPAGKSIRAGYALLEELGAIGKGDGSEVMGHGSNATDGEAATHNLSPITYNLTPLGRELFRLPVDPTVGRMILQARTEKCLREALVIASGLSIQDPRERPLDAREKADAAHRRFVHHDSDFLTLLNIWETYHDQFENLSQAKLRRFCHDHFLSYTRMREWRDIHSQLLDVLRERSEFRLTSVFDAAPNADLAFGTPGYRQIHRAILSGLLGNIALRDEENGGYKSTHDRRVAIFPGSVIFQREEKKKTQHDAGQRPAQKKGPAAPPALLCAEIMETSRLYARTCAKLDLLWVLDLGQHVLKVSHSEPFYQEDKARVLVKQKSRLYGLEIESRAVSYGKIDPRHATEIFIREALVNDTLTWPFDFVKNNRAVREKIEALLTRTRDGTYMNLDEGIYRFYERRLADTPVSAVGELVDLVRERRAADPKFLCLEPEDLRDPDSLQHDAESYPEALPLQTAALPLNYAYKPGQTDDGVTLEVGIREAEALTPAALDWAVPGHLEAKVEHYLRALPKELRRGFMPLLDTARDLAKGAAQHARLTERRDTLPQTLSLLIRERFRIAIDPTIWADKLPPDHLRVRVSVRDDEARELCAGRDLAELKAALEIRLRDASVRVARDDPEAWKRARQRWEKPEQTTWGFGDFPPSVPVIELAGVPIHAYPGLKPGEQGVSLRLFRTTVEAAQQTRLGLAQLLEYHLRYELAWLEKDLKSLRTLGALAATLVPTEKLQADAHLMLRRWLCDPSRVAKPTHGNFAVAVEKSKIDLRASVVKLTELLREILNLRSSLEAHAQPFVGLDKDLVALIPPDFLRTTSWERLVHFPRYLKAMKLRADRWRQNPAKDAERAKQIFPFVALVAGVRDREGGDACRWLLEEFRVSVFAQELGTAEPISAVKLEKAIAAAKSGGNATRSAVADAALTSDKNVAVPVTSVPAIALAAPKDAKKTPLKNLNALGNLFKR